MASGEQGYTRYLNGDKSGIDDIVREYNDSLIFFINGYVNDLMTAEDLAADTIVKLLVKRKKFKNDMGAGFKTWLFTVARNTALDWLRKTARHPHTPISDSEQYDLPSFEDKMLKTEQAKQLHSAMDKLCNDYREVLHLLYFEELSYADAAYVMHKNEKQIKNLAYRAKQSLKTVLEKEDFIYENL